MREGREVKPTSLNGEPTLARGREEGDKRGKGRREGQPTSSNETVNSELILAKGREEGESNQQLLMTNRPWQGEGKKGGQTNCNQ